METGNGGKDGKKGQQRNVTKQTMRNAPCATGGRLRLWGRLAAPHDVFQKLVHATRPVRSLQRMLRDKLGGGSESNNGTGGQPPRYSAANLCSFSEFGGVTGTHRALQFRTKEQGAVRG